MKSRFQIIGIGGAKEAGKSSLAFGFSKFLTTMNRIHMLDAFALPLKRALLAMHPDTTGWYTLFDTLNEYGTPAYMMGIDEEIGRLKKTRFAGESDWRWAMQSLGTEWGRDLIQTGLWTTFMHERIMRWRASLPESGPPCYFIVTDVRFPNEATGLMYAAQAIRAHYHLVRVERDFPAAPPTDTHRSETEAAQIEWDQVIHTKTINAIEVQDINLYMQTKVKQHLLPALQDYLPGGLQI